MSTVTKLVALSTLFYDWKRNTRSHTQPSFDASPKNVENSALISSLRETKGFSQLLAPVVGSPITKEELKQAMVARQAEWDALKANKEAGPQDEGMKRLIAFEFIFTHKGKLIEPEIMGATGNRRYFASFEAFFRIFRDSNLSLKDVGKVDYSLMVPVAVTEFASDLERFGAQLEENEMRDVGVQNTSYIDNLYAINSRLPTGKISQSWLRQKMGATSGQKYWHFLKIHNARPGLDLINRVMPEKEKAGVGGGYLSWGKLGSKFNDLVKISIASDPVTLAEYNADREREGKPDKKLTALVTDDQVNEALKGLMVQTGNKTKMAERSAIEAIAISGSKVRALAAKAILDPKGGEVYDLRLGAEDSALNAIDTIFDDKESFPVIEALLSRFAASEEKVRKHVLKQLTTIDFEVPAVAVKAKGK